jgi:hypothetical protein
MKDIFEIRSLQGSTKTEESREGYETIKMWRKRTKASEWH